MEWVRAVSDHSIPDRPPLTVSPGEAVSVGERDSTWPAFVFVTSTEGEGWVPERHLRRVGDGWVVDTAYDTTELRVTRGDEVEEIERDEASGWAWCRDRAGEEGWVPLEVLGET